MKSWQKYLSLFCSLTSFVVLSSAQDDRNIHFSYVDSVTYSQYLQKDWKSLDKTSRQAFRQGIDYYYLRMRAGIAMYERQKYMQAAGQFRKALALNEIDPVAMEYLYYALAFSGRKHDALLFYENHANQLKSKVDASIKPVRSFAVEAAWHSNLEPDIRSLFSTVNTGLNDGYQIITRRFFNTSFAFEHDLGKRLSLTHGGTFMAKSDYYYSQTPTSAFDTYEHRTRQYQYYAGLAINPGGGFLIRPSLHYINFTSPGLFYRDRRFGDIYLPAGCKFGLFSGQTFNIQKYPSIQWQSRFLHF